MKSFTPKFDALCESVLGAKENGNRMFPDGSKVKVTKLSEFTAEEFDLSEEEFQKALEHDGKTATVKALATVVSSPDEMGNYYCVEFEDGFEIDALSDYHFEKV